ncbi:MAG: hypothetical protein U5L07_18175 [Desulfobacterales bacterium]|nr:hypothetical protein [Desulfobacterales bacterium]
MADFSLCRLKVFNTWDPVEDRNFWEAEIEVPDNYSLFDLHLYMQQIIDFDNDHLFGFFAGRNERHRKLIFSEDAGYPFDGGEYEKILLKDIYPLKGLKLYYVFDFGDKWVFEFQKSRKKARVEQCVQYPRIVSDNGVRLIQYYAGE